MRQSAPDDPGRLVARVPDPSAAAEVEARRPVLCGSISDGVRLAPFGGHGGRLSAAAATWPKAPRPWIDLSTGINPRSYPAPRASLRARARLPDPAQVADLEAAAATFFGAAPEAVCATAGAEAAIRLLASTLNARRVAVVGPTYGGHAEAWRATGAEVTQVADLKAGEGADLRVLVNPNNPDGRTVGSARVLRAAEGNAWLIVDEAFVETAPELSVAAHAGGRLLVLRSFGKFWGLAGLRLGFIVGEPTLVARLRSLRGEWPVSADAIAAGLAAYADRRWAERARARLRRDAARLDAALSAAGYTVEGGAGLFRLARAPDAAARFDRLARRGVLARPFADRPDHLRFGLPPAGSWRRVEIALQETAQP